MKDIDTLPNIQLLEDNNKAKELMVCCLMMESKDTIAVVNVEEHVTEIGVEMMNYFDDVSSFVVDVAVEEMNFCVFLLKTRDQLMVVGLG